MTDECVFCTLIRKRERIYLDLVSSVVIVPLHPVTDGHLLVIPRRHVRDAVQAPRVTADAFRDAALVASGRGPCNIITSVGAAATQSVYHLHIHIVPRRLNDGLMLPWSGQHARIQHPVRAG